MTNGCSLLECLLGKSESRFKLPLNHTVKVIYALLFSALFFHLQQAEQVWAILPIGLKLEMKRN